METIYQDIAVRTGGDIYIGVVGPVRTGKSTFIKLNTFEPIINADKKEKNIIVMPRRIVFFLPIFEATIPTGIYIAIAETCATISGMVKLPPSIFQTFSAKTENDKTDVKTKESVTNEAKIRLVILILITSVRLSRFLKIYFSDTNTIINIKISQ